jgi:hypothetical protein
VALEVENGDVIRGGDSSKERSPADIYDPSLGAWDAHHKKPAFVATPQLFLESSYQCASSVAEFHDAG